jgi:hypothetical protein
VPRLSGIDKKPHILGARDNSSRILRGVERFLVRFDERIAIPHVLHGRQFEQKQLHRPHEFKNACSGRAVMWANFRKLLFGAALCGAAMTGLGLGGRPAMGQVPTPYNEGDEPQGNGWTVHWTEWQRAAGESGWPRSENHTQHCSKKYWAEFIAQNLRNSIGASQFKTFGYIYVTRD